MITDYVCDVEDDLCLVLQLLILHRYFRERRFSTNPNGIFSTSDFPKFGICIVVIYFVPYGRRWNPIRKYPHVEGGIRGGGKGDDYEGKKDFGHPLIT